MPPARPAPNALAGDTSGTPLPMPGFACTQVTVPGPIITPGIPAYCDPPVTIPGQTVPGTDLSGYQQLGSSTACWGSAAANASALYSCRERAGGKCVGRTPGNCSCTAVKTSARPAEYPHWVRPNGQSFQEQNLSLECIRGSLHDTRLHTHSGYNDPAVLSRGACGAGGRMRSTMCVPLPVQPIRPVARPTI